MFEWWTYALSDFLLFSPRAYYALIWRYNQDVWPLHVVAFAIGMVMSTGFVRPNHGRMRLGTAALGVAWGWIGWSFLWHQYVTINWAATWFAAAFTLQGLLLLLFAVSGLHTRGREPVGNILGAGLFVFALTAYPLVAPIMGRGWQAAEVSGILADPTAVATLAWIATFAGGAIKWWLMAIPGLWCLMTGATLWTLGAPDYFLAPVCALVAIVGALIPAR